jgi:tetratricopeptide (TPR) repeat protein
MADMRLRGEQSAAELYNAGNAALRSGRYAKAINRYTKAIELLPTFPEAYHNRAIAYANSGDERSCQRDLLRALTLDYDTEEFWPTFFNHMDTALVIDLLADARLPAALADRLRSRTEEAVQHGTVFLQEYPDLGMTFAPDSLPARYWLSRLVGQPSYLPAEVFTDVFDTCCHNTWRGDEELAWRTKFLIATVLYEEYQATEWSPDGQGGVFFDDDYLMNRPHWELPDGLLHTLVSAEMPPEEGESEKHQLARFTIALAFDAAQVLLQRRTALAPPPCSADFNWGLAHYLFKLLIGTAAYLGDAASIVRAVELARRLNAAIAAAGWTMGRHRPGALLAAVAPSPLTDREIGPSEPWPGTLLVDYFIYETGGDNLVRACLSPAAEWVSQRYVPPHEVSALLRLGAQWQDPEMFREVRDDPDVNQLHLLLNAWTAMGEVPDEAYDDWLDEALFGADVLWDTQDIHRLVIMPWNYLHNIPFHLMPEIRRRVDAGRLDEVVVSPSLDLTQRLAQRTTAPRKSASCLFVGIDSDEVDTRAEYDVVCASFDRTTALINRDATPERVLAAMAGIDVVHIACHGEFDLRKTSTYLLLAGGERLYPADLALLPGLRADLVLLNACVSGVSSRQARNGDPALGLPAALLYGGARQVIGTLWPLEAEAALAFTAAFYPAWLAEERSTAATVLSIQRELRARSADVFTWGAHSIFGDWR